MNPLGAGMIDWSTGRATLPLPESFTIPAALSAASKITVTTEMETATALQLWDARMNLRGRLATFRSVVAAGGCVACPPATHDQAEVRSTICLTASVGTDHGNKTDAVRIDLSRSPSSRAWRNPR